MGIITRTAKEIVRHMLHRAAADVAMDQIRRWRGIPTAYLRGSVSERFSSIYRTEAWSRWGGGAPGSGTGSTLEITGSIRAELPLLLRQLGCETILDIGCGDFNWMQHLNVDARYIGVDIAEEVIAINRAVYANERREFHLLDATRHVLPDADVVICREVLFHLGFDDIFRLLRNIVSKQRGYFIATTDVATLFNSDIRSGDFRILNLERPPFRFPKPHHAVSDDALVAGRRLAAWSIDQLRMLPSLRNTAAPNGNMQGAQVLSGPPLRRLDMRAAQYTLHR